MKINHFKLHFVCFVFFSTLFVALPTLAQDSALQISCVDASGKPLQGVKVTVLSLDNSKAKDKKSDNKGNAEFTKLDDGVYRIVGRKEGFAPALYEYAALKASRESVTLKLESGADKTLYFEDPMQLQKASELMMQGLEAFKQGKAADAEKLLHQSVELNPSGTDALYYLGVVCLQQAKYDQGVEFLNRAAGIAGILMNVPPAPGQPPAQHQQVSQSARQLLKKLPLIKGDNALKEKKYDVAIAEYSEAMKSEPNIPELQYNLALALTYSNRYDEAIQAVDRAIQLKPGEKIYTDLKAQISARKEKGILEKAQAVLNDGNKLLQDGDAAAALKKFEEANSMVPQERQAPIWRQIGRAQAKLNQPAAAEEAFKKSIELAPPDRKSEYRSAFARYYLDTQRLDQALDVLIDPKEAGSQNAEQKLLALAKSEKNSQPKLAEAALERVIRDNPQNADAYFDLGQMYYADGKEYDKRTRELLTKYIEIGKDPDKLNSAKDMLTIINRRSK